MPKVSEKVTVNPRKVAENSEKVTEKVTVNEQKVTVKGDALIKQLIDRASSNGEKLSANRIAILELMIDNPYITKVELAKAIGIREISIWRNIEAMRGKYLRRVGPDKGGFWEIIS